MTLEQYFVSIMQLYDHLQFSSALGLRCKPNLKDVNANRTANPIGLTFVADKENGSVCCANPNEELRDEFKQVFTTVDFLDYIYAVVHSNDYSTIEKDLLKKK